MTTTQKKTSHSLLATLLAVSAGLSLIFQPTSAAAQDEREYEEKATSEVTTGAAGASNRARMKREAKAEQAATPQLFPLATRTHPATKASLKGGKELRELVALYDAQKYPETMQKADAIGGSEFSNAYDKSFAYQLAANAAADAGQDAKAVDYYKKALASDGLDNNGHYQVMYNLAVVQYGQDDHAGALTTLDRFLGETKAEKPEYVSLKAALLSSLDRPQEAAALYEQALAKNPSDKKTLMNAVALYQQAGNPDKASALLLEAQKKGLLTEAREYRALYVGFIEQGKLQDAIAAIDDGVAKGAIAPSPELANDYSVIAQAAYAAKDVATAVAMYKRAASIASNGEPALNLAKVLLNEGRTSEARQAAQQALDKGVKAPDQAKSILAQGGK